MKHKNLLTNERGFTLTEILIAIVVISISVVIISRMDNYSFRGSQYLNRTNNALLIIDNTIESLRLSIVRDNKFDLLTNKTFTEDGITVSYTIQAAPDPMNSAATLANVKQIDLVAKWQRTSTKTDSITISTCLARLF